ncbi:putative endo-beta-1,4-glucanase D [Cercospora beticola]|nr:putative endo-beta-1,4-glucanase D [Cercospora beticola]PIA95940.1 putative endo-beta-1,4-glucanase D [Cercospora beticola]
MSKAPGDVASYDGTGDWFKAYENGVTGSPSQDTNWGTWQKDRIEFTIPKEIPDGEYLVRPEHIAIHEGHVGKAQFYMECAQLRISGGGNGTPSPLVKIPGLYSAQDPGIAFNKWGGNVGNYEMPGPAVWSGGGSGGSASTSSSGNNSTAEVSVGGTGAATSDASSPGASTSGGSTPGGSAGSAGTGGTTGTSAATGSAGPANGSSGSQAGSSGGSSNTWGTTAGQAPSWGSWTAGRFRRSFIA